jgi:hypothetical protein
MGDDQATWRCRSSQWASDGQRCHTVVEIRLTSRTIGSFGLGPRRCPTDRNGSADKQDRRSRRAKLLWLSSPKRRPALQEGPRSCPKAPARCRAVSGLGHEAVHGQMVTHGTPPMRPATLLAHPGTTDPCGGEVSQRGTMAPQPTWDRGPVRPGERDPDARHYPLSPARHAGPDHRAVPARLNRRPGRAPQDRLCEQPLAHPADRDGRPGAACRPGSRPGGAAPHPIRLCRLVGRAAEEPTSSGGEQQDRAATQEPTAHPAGGEADRVTCSQVIA